MQLLDNQTIAVANWQMLSGLGSLGDLLGPLVAGHPVGWLLGGLWLLALWLLPLSVFVCLCACVVSCWLGQVQLTHKEHGSGDWCCMHRVAISVARCAHTFAVVAVPDNAKASGREAKGGSTMN